MELHLLKEEEISELEYYKTDAYKILLEKQIVLYKDLIEKKELNHLASRLETIKNYKVIMGQKNNEEVLVLANRIRKEFSQIEKTLFS